MRRREHFVYWLYALDGTCLYVGCTRKPQQRWDQHRVINKPMVSEVARRRMAGPYDFKTARRIEFEQQILLRPKYDHRCPSSRPYFARTGPAAEIRAVMAVKRVTMKALAEKTGIPANRLSDQIIGRKVPVFGTVQAISKALDVPLARLFRAAS